jgi:hypothetical protein
LNATVYFFNFSAHHNRDYPLILCFNKRSRLTSASMNSKNLVLHFVSWIRSCAVSHPYGWRSFLHIIICSCALLDFPPLHSPVVVIFCLLLVVSIMICDIASITYSWVC